MPSKTREEDISVDSAPTSIDPYIVLSLSKDATQDQVKTAYRKAALVSHPDKAAPEAKDAAHAKFQEVAFAYAILSDERRRKRYDTTGSTEESLIEDEDFDWGSFFRDQFSDVVSFDSVDKFAQEYKGSEEERGHVLQAYDQGKGNMDRVYSSVMLSDVLEDDERFRAIIDKAIANGEAEPNVKYTNETQKSKEARRRRAIQVREREAPEAEESRKEILEKKAKAGGKKRPAGDSGDLGDLAVLIQRRQGERQQRSDNFFDNLEAKYAPKSSKKGSKRAMEEPPEEAFAKNAKKSKSSKR